MRRASRSRSDDTFVRVNNSLRSVAAANSAVVSNVTNIPTFAIADGGRKQVDAARAVLHPTPHEVGRLQNCQGLPHEADKGRDERPAGQGESVLGRDTRSGATKRRSAANTQANTARRRCSNSWTSKRGTDGCPRKREGWSTRGGPKTTGATGAATRTSRTTPTSWTRHRSGWPWAETPGRRLGETPCPPTAAARFLPRVPAPEDRQAPGCRGGTTRA